MWILDSPPMSVPEEQPATRTERFAALFATDGESRAVPRAATVALGLFAAVLVAASTASAVELGYPTIGTSFLAAVALFVGAVAVLEAGRLRGVR